MTTTAKIKAKGISIGNDGLPVDSGISIGAPSARVAVVELIATRRSDSTDGKVNYDYEILTIEAAPTEEAENHVRALARAFYMRRKGQDGQLTLEQEHDELTVAEVLEGGAHLQPHLFSPSALFVEGEEGPRCLTCDLSESDGPHVTEDELPTENPDEDEPKEKDDAELNLEPDVDTAPLADPFAVPETTDEGNVVELVTPTAKKKGSRGIDSLIPTGA